MNNKCLMKIKKITSTFMMLQLFVGLFAPGIVFATAPTPNPQTLISPANDVYVNYNDLVFQWTTATDVHLPVEYKFQVSTSSAVNNAPASYFISGVVYEKDWDEGLTTSTLNASDAAMPLVDGVTYYWHVRAEDSVGGSVDNRNDWSEVRSFTIDNTIPDAPIITSPSVEKYFKTTPILNQWGSITTDLSGISQYRVEYIYDDGHTFSGAPYRTTTNNWRNHTPGPTEQGGVTIRVQGIDNAGNYGSWSAPVHYTYDSISPTVSIDSPSSGDHLSGMVNIIGTTNDLNPKFTTVTIENLDTMSGDQYLYHWDDYKNYSNEAIAGWDTTSFDEGLYRITLTATDAAGNSSEDTVDVVVDNTYPNVNLDDPTPGYAKGVVDIVGTVTDINLKKTVVKVKNLDTSIVTIIFIDNPSSQYVSEKITPWDTKLFANGNYKVILRGVDYAGNVVVDSVKTVVVDNTKPSVSVVMPSDGQLFNGAVPIAILASDSSGIASASMHIYNNYTNSLVSGCTSIPTIFDGTYWNTTVNSGSGCILPSDGSYKIKAWAYDNAGNPGWASHVDFVYDTTAPVSFVDTLSEYSNTEKFNINVTSTDTIPSNFLQITEEPTLSQGSGVDYVELWYRKDKTDPYQQYCVNTPETERLLGGPLCEYKPNESGDITINFDTIGTGGDGFYEFYSIAVDNAGNREMVPTTSVSGLEALVKEGVMPETEVLPDASTTVDTKSPVITLIGNNPLTITQGTTFADPGASTDDGTDVVQTGSVDTNVIGSYLRYYDSTDLAGNVAVQITRTVNVVAAPILLSPLTTTAGGDTGAPGEVLGTTDENVDEQEKEVKGAEDTNDNKKDNDNKTAGTFMGLMWYWWILIVAGLTGGYWLFAFWRRRRKEV